MHGANRLGGNSLAEIIIFGKRAGVASVNYSRNLKQQVRSNKIIYQAHDNINKFIKNGNELVRPLQKELQLIMWKFCGVIKNEELLLKGLKKIKELKIKSKDVDVRIDEYSCEDLVLILDLQSSLMSAEATIISALERNESRGAHQRSDFPEINSSYEFNILVKLNKNKILETSKVPLRPLNPNMKAIIEGSTFDDDIKNKLLE